MDGKGCIKIIRNKIDVDKNIWGKKCSCNNFVYRFCDEHLYINQNIKKEIMCPNCGKVNDVYIEEARNSYCELIYDCFKEVKGKVLELGCGGGLLTKYFTNKKDVNEVVAIDNNMEENELNYINSLDKCKFKKVNLNNYDEEIFNECFDYVVCKDVVMYLDDIEYTFSKLSKISNNIILLNWYNSKHKNCLNKTKPNDVYKIIKKYYKNIKITYPSFYKWGYIIKTIN